MTPYPVYGNRRRFMQGLGAVGTLAASAGLYRWFNPVRKMDLETAAIEGLATVELTQEQRRNSVTAILAGRFPSRRIDVATSNKKYQRFV